MDNLIYLASPYSNPDPTVREQRFALACEAAGVLMRQGHIILSPIAHSHPVACRCELPKDWEFWQRIDCRLILACDELWVLCLPGWRESVGVKAETRFARQHGRTVRYLEPEGLLGRAITLPLKGIGDEIRAL